MRWREGMVVCGAWIVCGCGGEARPTVAPVAEPAAPTATVAHIYGEPLPPPAADPVEPAVEEDRPKPIDDASLRSEQPSWTTVGPIAAPDALKAAAESLLQGEPQKARSDYDRVMQNAQLSKTEQMGAEALGGRIQLTLGNHSRAAQHHERVMALWGELKPGLAGLATADQEMALSALAEARFAEAEKLRLAAAKLQFPEFKAEATVDAVNEHVKKRVAPWVQAKLAAIRQAEEAYIEVLKTKPLVPMWTVRSSSRVGAMWADFLADVRSTPVPKAWLGDGQTPEGVAYPKILAVYRDALDDMSAPFFMKAQSSFGLCLSEGESAGIEDAFVASCRGWLDRNGYN